MDAFSPEKTSFITYKYYWIGKKSQNFRAHGAFPNRLYTDKIAADLDPRSSLWNRHSSQDAGCAKLYKQGNLQKIFRLGATVLVGLL